MPLPRKLKKRWRKTIIDKEYDQEIENARKKKDHDEVSMLIEMRQNDEYLDYIDEEVSFTRDLIRTGRKLRVAIPAMRVQGKDLSDDWCRDDNLDENYLSPSGILKVQEGIRKEIAWRQQSRAHWIMWISATTGFIGALTGLLAVYFKMRN